MLIQQLLRLIDILGTYCEPRGRCANQSDDGGTVFPEWQGNLQSSQKSATLKYELFYKVAGRLWVWKIWPSLRPGANPLPWGHTALTANATWCLTDYTEEDGALAYVPGSHKSNAHPDRRLEISCAGRLPKGSVIVWPGSTWHGAYPKKTLGLRLNAVAYYRHQAVCRRRTSA